jgi:AcrR family transcriptional regulator
MTRKIFHHESGEVRRQELIAATLECIARRGLQGATVREIAKAAGVTGGLIRHYFTSKELLLQAAYLELMDMMSAAAIKRAEEAGNCPRTRLKTFIVANFRAPIVDPRILSLWATFIGQIHQDPSLAAIHRKSYLNYRNTLEELLASFFADCGKSASQAEMRACAIAINGIIDGLWLEGCMASDLFDEDELAAIAISSAERILRLPLDMPEAETTSRKENA